MDLTQITIAFITGCALVGAATLPAWITSRATAKKLDKVQETAEATRLDANSGLTAVRTELAEANAKIAALMVKNEAQAKDAQAVSVAAATATPPRTK